MAQEMSSAAQTAVDIRIEDCLVEYKNFTLDVDEFHLPKGTATAILGPSGSGKSTLLNTIGKLKNEDCGRVYLDGVEAKPKDVHGRVTVVFQRPYLSSGTVYENVGYGLKIKGVPAKERRIKADKMLETVGLAGMGYRNVRSLSGGEAQRVALARALVVEPQALFLDEPLASLDPALKRKITAEFSRILHEMGVTVLYVTHDFNEALVIADYIAVMVDGKVKAHGPARQTISLTQDPEIGKFLNIDLAIDAVVESTEANLITINTPVGTLHVEVEEEYAPGDRLVFSVRPEDIHVRSLDKGTSSSGQNNIYGTVESIEPLGEYNGVRFRLDQVNPAYNTSGRELYFIAHVTSSDVKAMGVKEGEKFRLSFSPYSVYVEARE